MQSSERTNSLKTFRQNSMISLFSLNNLYNSTEMNQMMKTSTKLFEKISPLFTETLTNFNNTKKNLFINPDTNTKTIYNSSHKNSSHFRSLSTSKTFKVKNSFNSRSNKKLRINKNNILLANYNNNSKTSLSPENPPSNDDKIKLTSYYKISGEYTTSKSYKSPEEKEKKRNLFQKYQINKANYLKNIKFLPQIDERNLHLKIIKTYFKNHLKADKTIDINKQLVKRIDEMDNFFLFKKYAKDIEKTQQTIYYNKKMPKVHIRPVKPTGMKISEEFNKFNFDDEEKKNGGKGNNYVKKKNDPKSKFLRGINTMGTIRMEVFRKFAFNYIIQSPENNNNNNSEENPQKNLEKIGENENNDEDLNNSRKSNNYNILYKKKTEKHYLSLYITSIIPSLKPNSRVKFATAQYENRIYLYGGLTSILSNEMWVYFIEKNKWRNIPVKQNDVPLGRHSHTLAIVNNNLFIVGGEMTKEMQKSSEELMMFNIQNEKYYFPNIPKKKNVNHRKGHISVATNSTFMIQGGIDIASQNFDNSCYIYNLGGQMWFIMESVGEPLPYRAYHCATMANNYTHYSSGPYSFYYPPEDLLTTRPTPIRYEGVYMFGGLNERKTFCNDLYIIKIGRKPCICLKPKIAGQPPEPRINAKMTFIEKYSFLVIHGGTKSNQMFCSDLYVLNLDNYNWLKTMFSETLTSTSSLLARTEHDIFFYGNKLYIFGGLGEKNLLSMNFEVAEFEVTGFFDSLLQEQNEKEG